MELSAGPDRQHFVEPRYNLTGTEMNLRIRDTRTTLRVIGWLQLIGGVCGLGIMGYLMVQADSSTTAYVVIIVTGVLLFLFSLLCGLGMIRTPYHRTSMHLSIANQCLQVFQVNIGMYGLAYSSGLKLTFGLKNRSIAFAAGISDFKMSLNSASDVFLLINVVPIAVLFVLFDILKERQVIKEQSIAAHG